MNLAVSCDHLGKKVGCCERDVSHGRVCRRSFHRERVFELVGQLAQFAQSAGGGVALQRVNCAPHAAHNLLVTGTLFQLQGFVIQRLQQFLRRLIEEVPQFRAALVGGIRHSRTSSRW